MPKTRVQLDFNPEEMALLERCKNVLNATSRKETIRRSLYLMFETVIKEKERIEKRKSELIRKGF
jgi:hypothetical protein